MSNTTDKYRFSGEQVGIRMVKAKGEHYMNTNDVIAWMKRQQAINENEDFPLHLLIKALIRFKNREK